MKKFYTFAKRYRLFAALFLILASSSSFALRVDQYPVTKISTPFTEIVNNGGQLFNYGNIGWQSYQTNWEDNCTITMPFNFTFDDKVYTAGNTLYAHVGSINFTYWDVTGNVCYYYPIMDMSTITGWPSDYCKNSIAVYSGLQAGNQNYTSGVYYQVTGSAPGRILTVEWYQMGNYYAADLGTCSYEIRLYEGSNVIELLYEKLNFTMTSSNYMPTYFKTVGLNGDISPTFKQLIIKNPSDNSNKYYSTPGTNYRLGEPPINVQLSSTPKLVDMGSVILGTSSNGTVTVTNTGDNINGISKLSIRTVTLTGDPDFTLTSVPASSDSIIVGATRSIGIKFNPQFDGLRTAVLTITSNGADSGTQTIAIKGIGLAALISIDTNIIFKNTFTKLGSFRDARVIIRSTGVPTLQISGYQFSGLDANQYSIVKAPTTIAGGQSDTLIVRYTPTIEGRHTATVTIINNSLNNPSLPVTLWGTGTLPHIIVTPTMLNFDSVALGGAPICKTIRIYNPGTDTLLIFSNTMVKNDGDFTFTALSGTDSIIPPDKSREITVCFTPKQKGSRVARLRLTTNIPRTFEQVRRDTASSFLFDINGNGVPTGVLSQSFADVETSGWIDSAIIGTEVCTTDTIFNNGDADVVVNSLTLGGAAAADFTVSGKAMPFILKAKSSTVVTVCAKPSVRGLNTANLVVGGSANEKPISNTAQFSIKGLAVCATSDPGLLFNNHLVVEGTDSLECVTVTNCGDVPTSYTASLPAGATDYSINGPANSGVIAAGATAQFCVRFHPSTMGSTPTTLTITPSTPELAAQTVAINGVGACANVTAAAPTIDGSAGGTFTFTVTINNAGNYPWTPGAPVLTQPESAFDITGQTVTPDPIPANGSGTLTVTYKPTEINHTYTGAITFPNAAPACSNTASINISHTTGTLAVASKSEEAGFSLGQNYPNPFGAATSFSFTTPSEASVVVAISDLTGRHIRTITSGRISAGEHPVTIDAENLTSGTYILTLESGSVRLTRQIVVVK